MGTDERKRALVVDDDPRNRKLLDTLLRFDGYEVRSADSGSAALGAIAAGPLPDVILLDIMMPGMDGFELVRRLKADPVAGTIPVVVVTALDDAASRLRLAAAGIERVITKPIDRWALKSCLDDLTARPTGNT